MNTVLLEEKKEEKKEEHECQCRIGPCRNKCVFKGTVEYHETLQMYLCSTCVYPNLELSNLR